MGVYIYFFQTFQIIVEVQW